MSNPTEHKYIYPQAYLHIGNAFHARAYKLLEAIEVIRYESIHGDFSMFSEQVQKQLKTYMNNTIAILEGTHEKEMDSAVAYWQSYKSTKRTKEK